MGLEWTGCNGGVVDDRQLIFARCRENVMLPVSIYNERTKLTATWFNGLSLAVFGVGGFGPWIALLSGANPHPDFLLLLSVSAICFLTS
jgi:hypothetical protein